MSEQIIGRPIWRVVFDYGKLQFESAAPDVEDRYSRTFDIFIDPDTARLLTIVSRWPQGVARIPPEPDAASVTEQLRGGGDERYYEFPEEAPPISFLMALDALFRLGDPVLNTAQIKARTLCGPGWARIRAW